MATTQNREAGRADRSGQKGRQQVAPGGDLRLERLTKRFGSFTAVQELSLTIPQGAFFALLGPSGCGKTTTLRMIAGLEDPTAGSIRIGASDLTHAKPYKRPVNTVFQSYALFPHLDVFDNVAFGLRRRGEKDVKRRVEEALALVELGHLGRRRPAQLSGGQQQRVALARAVVNRPQLLLLDEPLGALDLKLRRQMQLELKRIQTEVGITFVHVTHDQEEAMTMADTVAVMNHGRIEQLGDPVDLYEFPKTAFVANFLGQSNLVPARRTGSGAHLPVDVHGQTIQVPADRCRTSEADLLIGVRPEKLHLAPAGPDGPGVDRQRSAGAGSNVLAGGVVADVSFCGVSTQYTVRMPWSQELTVFAQNRGVGGLTPAGTPVTLTWEPEHTFALPAQPAEG